MSDADSDSDDDEIDMLFLQMMHRRDIPKIVGFVEDTVPEMDNLEFRRDFRCQEYTWCRGNLRTLPFHKRGRMTWQNDHVMMMIGSRKMFNWYHHFTQLSGPNWPIHCFLEDSAMLIFVICYIISKEEDIPAHFSAEVFCATAFDKFVDDATQCILGCTRRASRAALLCRGGAQPARRVCNRVENRTYRVVTRVVSRVIIERTRGWQSSTLAKNLALWLLSNSLIALNLAPSSLV